MNDHVGSERAGHIRIRSEGNVLYGVVAAALAAHAVHLGWRVIQLPDGCDVGARPPSLTPARHVGRKLELEVHWK